jgi:hypothetical protein
MPTSPFRIATPLEQLAAHIDGRLDILEATIMATKAQIEQAFADQSAAFTDYAADVTATLADLSAKLDAALANDSADAAALAEMKSLTDDVVTRTDAIKSADAPVDRP